jgi:hypothetical protein
MLTVIALTLLIAVTAIPQPLETTGPTGLKGPTDNIVINGLSPKLVTIFLLFDLLWYFWSPLSPHQRNWVSHGILSNRSELFISSFDGNPFSKGDMIYHEKNIANQLTRSSTIEPAQITPKINWGM